MLLNKIKKIFLLYLSIVALWSCSNGDLSQKITECYYPDSPKEKAPLWVCGAKIDGISVSAVGMVEKSPAGVNFTKQQAIANARSYLAQNVKSHIQSTVSNNTSQVGVGDQQKIEQSASVLLNQITDQSLQGTRVFKEATSSKGTLYVIVGFDNELYANFIQEIINKNIGNISDPNSLKEVLIQSR